MTNDGLEARARAVPVSDVDRAKAFYADQVGFNADHDHTLSDELRFVQLTPPGSACSIAIGRGLSTACRRAPSRACRSSSPTSQAAAPSWSARGVDVSDVQVFPWGSFVFFKRPRRQRLGRAAATRARLSSPPGDALFPARTSRVSVTHDADRLTAATATATLPT